MANEKAVALLIKNSFIAKLQPYMAEPHPQVLRDNPTFSDDFMDYLSGDFAIFIENACTNNGDNSVSMARSVASIAWPV